jgi:cytoskeletal protein RodZ
MHVRRRVLRLASATAAAVLSGGVAWAASGVPVPTLAPVHSSVDSTTSSTETTSSEPPTTVEETTKTVAETPTTVDEPPTTVQEPTTTSLPEAPKSSECKPGWGYGDTNHCHLGPPGLNKKQGHEQQRHDKNAHKGR